MKAVSMNTEKALVVAGPLIVYRDLMRLKGVGRPGTITELETTKLVALLQRGCSVKYAAHALGISTRAYYRKYQADEKFRREMDAARAFMVIAAHQTIYQHIDEVKVAMWYLERRDRKRYGLRSAATPQALPAKPQVPHIDAEAAVQEFIDRGWLRTNEDG